MCIKCGYKNIDINTKKAQEAAFKVQLAQALTVGVVGFMNCIFSAADPNFSGGVSTTYKKRTEEVEEKKPQDPAKMQGEIEDILGKEEFGKLPDDMQKDILTKYDAFKNVLKLEGDNLSARVKTYVEALQAHKIELEMGEYSGKLFENALKEVAANPESPTTEELEKAKELAIKNKRECSIKIENSNIEEQRKTGTDEEYYGALKDRGQGYVDMYDKNNDEVIEFNEFKALEEKDSGRTLSENEVAKTQEFFNKIDKDKNGKLDANEMASHLYAVSRMHDTGQGPNTVSDITFQEWIDSQQILDDSQVEERYRNIYNQLYGVLKPE